MKPLDQYLDHIYILNLDRRKDRWIKMQSKLSSLSWDQSKIERFSATDGRHLTEAWKKLPYFLSTPGVLAVLFSIQRILKDAWDKKYQKFLILEDDVIFHKEFKDKWANLKLPTYWKLLFLGNSMHQWRFKERCTFHSGYLTCKGSIPGAFAICIDRDAIPLLWKTILNGRSPWDLTPLKMVNQQFPKQCLVLHPPLCIAEVEDSDLRQRNMAKKAKDCGWNLSNFI